MSARKLNARQHANLLVLAEREERGEDPIPSGVSSPWISALGLHGNTLRGLRRRGLIRSDDSTGWKYLVTDAGRDALGSAR